MLYLGPRDTLTVVPIARADYEGTPYEREMNRRLEILFGKPTSMFAVGAETQQFPRELWRATSIATATAEEHQRSFATETGLN
jgi:hypothetical protein